MSVLDLSAILLTLSAVLGWLNRKFVLLPHAIGLLVMGVAASLVVVGLDAMVPGHRASAELGRLLAQIDFSAVVMNGMLAFLIFAGALHVDVAKLRSHAAPVVVLAILGTVISTAIVGGGFWAAARVLGHEIPLVWALVFGALISPTDPVAVMSTLKSVSIPAKLEVQLQGESLFNDGVGIVLFTVLLRYATGAPAAETTPAAIGELLLLEAGGGLLLGTVTGYLAYRAMLAIDDYPVEVLVTLALVTATYAIAEQIHVSGPLAIVAAGLLIGDLGPRYAMSDTTRKYVFALWTLIDEVLNSVLFLLIGLEMLIVAFDRNNVVLALLSIPLVIAARGVALTIPLALFAWSGQFSAANLPFLTWAGVRGGISVALALAVPDSPSKSIILVSTYAVVLFCIVVQGSTLGIVARRTVRPRTVKRQNGSDPNQAS